MTADMVFAAASSFVDFGARLSIAAVVAVTSRPSLSGLRTGYAQAEQNGDGPHV